MAYTLHIVFSGLCLFAPEPVQNPTRLHVLIPDTESDRAIEKKIHLHLNRLYYDKAYETGDPAAAGKHFVRKKLDGWALDLSGLEANALDERLPGVLNARHFTSTDLQPGSFGPSPVDDIASRVTLGSGSFTGRCDGACWMMDGEGPFPMAHVVRWSMVVRGDTLPWGLDQLRGSGHQPLKTLKPIDGEIVLAFLHLGHEEHPAEDALHEHMPRRDDEKSAGGALRKGTPAPHFAAYYDMFGSPEQTIPIPTFHSKPTGNCSLQDFLPKGLKLPPPSKGIEMTCMVTKATDPGTPS
jgi:hypothetical protein